MIYVFEAYDFDIDRRALCCAGLPVRLEPKVFDLLAYLIEHHDHFVSREELYTQLWPEQFVSESALSYCMTEARKAVGDTGRVQRVIKTVHGRGYRFILPVEQHLPDSAAAAEGTLPPPLPATARLSPPQAEVLPATSTSQSAPAFPLRPALAREHTRPGAGTFEPEWRQLTVLWCRGVVASVHSRPLDPEELHPIIQDVQRVYDAVIQRFEGWMAQHFGDGFVVYFGHPLAHEDDARRAVHTALEIVRGMARLSQDLKQQSGVEFAVHMGIHTGMVVISAISSGDGRTPLAVGNTPQVAAQLASLAAPNTVVMSPVTLKLVEGYFVCGALGTYILDNPTESLVVYQVLRESAAQSRLDVALATRLTPFVGREHEIGWLRERWEQSTGGQGQVVVLQGEAGIGKSRLIHEFHVDLAGEAYTSLECRCSPYAQQSPFYPLVEPLARWLQWHPDDTPSVKLQKLEQSCEPWHGALEEIVPLWAALLSLPLPARYAALDLTPRRQKQRTFEVLLAWFLRLAALQPLCLVVEDLHWADSSTLEFLDLFVDQVPMACLLVILACRPDFPPPWTGRSYITQLALSRLTPAQTARMIERMTTGEALPAAIHHQLVVKTNGVPLFVEEMTKMVLELGLDKEKEADDVSTGHPPALAIPSTLHDSLMARLDLQGQGKLVAQLGATLGREFPYRLLQAISPLDEAVLQQGLTQLVQAEILYQRGLPPQAQYIFKHALIQDAAYQSLLRRTRRQYHKQIAQVLEECFPETCTSQPELVAHHYTEAGQSARAIAYWQRAGERALQRSANIEAISHLRRGLEVLTTLPETSELVQQELSLQSTLGSALTAARGYASPEVETAYARAYELGQQAWDTPQLLPVLWGLWFFAIGRAEYGRAQALGEHLLHMGQRVQDSLLLLAGHTVTGTTLLFQGELVQAHRHLEQSVSLYDLQQYRTLAFLYGMDYGMVGRAWLGWQRLVQGYPSQGLQHSEDALRLAQEVAHPYNLASILLDVIVAQLWRREVQRTREQAEALIALATEHGFTLRVAHGALVHGWALVMQGKTDGGLAQMRQALSAIRATGAALAYSWFLGMFAEACGEAGQIEEGLHTINEALAHVDKTDEHIWEAELHRLKGELLCRHKAVEAAETCFQQAITVARGQGAKWLELRAAVNLCRLWQQQGKHNQARCLLGEIYGWFTEGFDTGDLKEAKALLDELR